MCCPRIGQDRLYWRLLRAARSFLPKGDQKIPKGSQKIPKRRQKIPKGDQKIPKGSQKLPKRRQKIPEGDQKIPKGSQKIPKGSQNIPKGDQFMASRSLPYKMQCRWGVAVQGWGYMDRAIPRQVESYIQRKNEVEQNLRFQYKNVFV